MLSKVLNYQYKCRFGLKRTKATIWSWNIITYMYFNALGMLLFKISFSFRSWQICLFLFFSFLLSSLGHHPTDLDIRWGNFIPNVSYLWKYTKWKWSNNEPIKMYKYHSSTVTIRIMCVLPCCHPAQSSKDKDKQLWVCSNCTAPLSLISFY